MDPQQALPSLRNTLPPLQHDTRKLIEIARRQAALDGRVPIGVIQQHPELPGLRDSILRRLKILVHTINSAEAKNEQAIKRGPNNFIPGRQPVRDFALLMAPLKQRLQDIQRELAAALGDIQPPEVKGQHGKTIDSWEQTMDHFVQWFTEQPDHPQANYDLVFRNADSAQAGFDPTVLLTLLYGVFNVLLTRRKNRDRFKNL